MRTRQLDAQGQSLLSSFAGMASHQLEQHSAASMRIQRSYFSGHAAALSNAIHGFSEPMMLCDTSNQQHWRVAAVNQAWLDTTRICRCAVSVSLASLAALCGLALASEHWASSPWRSKHICLEGKKCH